MPATLSRKNGMQKTCESKIEEKATCESLSHQTADVYAV